MHRLPLKSILYELVRNVNTRAARRLDLFIFTSTWSSPLAISFSLCKLAAMMYFDVGHTYNLPALGGAQPLRIISSEVLLKWKRPAALANAFVLHYVVFAFIRTKHVGQMGSFSARITVI
jgi:hypothetical protein